MAPLKDVDIRRARKIILLDEATTSPLYTGKGVWSSIHTQNDGSEQFSHCSSFKWDSLALAPYNDYKKLFWERKKALPPTVTMTGSFLDLPRELRDIVYRHVLAHDSTSIEFSAKTTFEQRDNSIAREHHFQKYCKDISPGLHLLRVNKQINREAASMFYGENEFRFTSSIGIFILDAWLRKIGAQHRRLVRRIAVHVPWNGIVTDCMKENSGESMRSMARVQNVIGHMGLSAISDHDRASKRSCLARIKKSLQTPGQLMNLTLILPDSFEPMPVEYQGRDGFEWILDPQCFEKLKVQLVRLHGGFVDFPTNIWYSAAAALQHARRERAICLAKQLEARAFAASRGVEFVDMPYDEMGYWPVPLREGDKMLEIERDALEEKMVKLNVRSELIDAAFRRPVRGSWD